MEKKNVLFVIPSLSAGGGEKSLINLLTQIDYEKYNIDLFLFNHEGLFMNFIPKEVQVLPLPDIFKLFSLPFFKSIKELVFIGEISVAYNRLVFLVKNKSLKNVSTREQYTWKNVSKSLSPLEKKYDAAIGFLEKTSTYFCVDKVLAKKKLGWIHIDYDQLGMDPVFDIPYFEKLDQIVTVSEECANIFKNRFPTQKNKVKVIYNVISPTIITRMANQVQTDVYNRKENEIIILSIGRLHYQKGFEIAIESCKKLLDKGYKVKWNIIGEGGERETLTKLIKEYGLEDFFNLLGLKSNPFPYIKQADFYVQTSRFEGKSIAIDEAKILNKPIITTNYSTAKDQIHHGENGLIAEMNADSVAEKIEWLIKDINLRNKFEMNLAKLNLGTEGEINKLYKILSG
ncbi:MAG: glycosyltransferase [Bacillota bacterium]|nr:glycosyltransferase [Bacillota bacterium]